MSIPLICGRSSVLPPLAPSDSPIRFYWTSLLGIEDFKEEDVRTYGGSIDVQSDNKKENN